MEMNDGFGKARTFVVKDARFTDQPGLVTIYERHSNNDWASVQDITMRQALIIVGALAACGAVVEFEIRG